MDVALELFLLKNATGGGVTFSISFLLLSGISNRRFSLFHDLLNHFASLRSETKRCLASSCCI